MDGNTFDKLSVSVHRLRERASRRGAVRLLLGGSLLAAGAGAAADAEAKHKNKNKNKHKNKNKNKNKKYCRGYGTTCNHSGDCCNGRCRNGFCFPNGGGGGGGNCGGQYCPNGWRCRNQGGVQVCVPDNFNNYCGNNTWYGPNYNCCNGFYGGGCLTGGDCCGGAGLCCQSGWQCCGGGTCIPRGWDCNDFFFQAASDEIGIEAADRIPSMAPTPVDADAYFVSTPVE